MPTFERRLATRMPIHTIDAQVLVLNPPLTDVEVRVLGSLMEKEVTTPDNYPLTLSALVAACNQTTSRDPIMRLDDTTVSATIVDLRRRGLLRAIQPSGARVTKYMHLLTDVLDLDGRERAVLGVLMLRGPQTVGELHTRTARLAEFPDLAAIEATLAALIAREAGALVVTLARRPGQKELRHAHLLSGEPVVRDAFDTVEADDPGAARASGRDERLEEMERTVTELRAEVATLRTMFEEFRAQFQ